MVQRSASQHTPRRRPHLLVLVGIPGSGKTSYAQRLFARCSSLRMISPDLVRESLCPGYAAGRILARHIDDHHVFRIAYRAVAEALEAGDNVLFDATSLTIMRRRKLINLSRRFGAIVSARYFPIELREALHRNNLRPRQVPPGVIAHMANILQPPQHTEGFDRVIVHQKHSSAR